jgi:hypothetical protein
MVCGLPSAHDALTPVSSIAAAAGVSAPILRFRVETVDQSNARSSRGRGGADTFDIVLTGTASGNTEVAWFVIS